jgi:hypothetical protein
MTVVTTDYGKFKTHEGTLAECAAAVVGKNFDHLFWMYDSTGKCVCIEKR